MGYHLLCNLLCFGCFAFFMPRLFMSRNPMPSYLMIPNLITNFPIDPSIHRSIHPSILPKKIKGCFLNSAHNSPYHSHQTPNQTYFSAALAPPTSQNSPLALYAPSSPGWSAAVPLVKCRAEGTHATAAVQAVSRFRSSSAGCCVWCSSWCRMMSGIINTDGYFGCYCLMHWLTGGV